MPGMPILLHLDSSAEQSLSSRSRAIGVEFAAAFRGAQPDNVVLYRDLHADPLPHLADASLHWAPGLRPAGSNPEPGAADLQQTLISELLAADVVLIGVPLYNYSLPSSLKAWLDHVHVPGLTVPMDASPAPLAGRAAVLIASRGGDYDRGSVNEGRDHATPVLQLTLGEGMGMSVTIISTSLTLASTLPALADQLARSEVEYSRALEAAADLGLRLGSAVGIS
jgi:FMN-dependent NADH-azoreductase